MGEKAIKSKKYGAYKVTRTLFYIFLIPFLLVSIFSAYVMFNSKSVGGYPSFFNYTVIQIENNNMYDSNNITKYPYKQGLNQLFEKNSSILYEIGDIVAFYSEDSDKVAEYNDSTNYNDIWKQSRTASTNSSSSNANFSPVSIENQQAEVTVGEITNMSKEKVLVGDTKYYLFVISYNLSDYTQEKVIIVEDIIGKAVQNNALIIDTLNYCASSDSFVTLIIIPCLLLVSLAIIKFVLLNSFMKEDLSGKKQSYIEQENSLEEKTKDKKIDKKRIEKELKELKELEKDTKPTPPTKSVPPRPVPPRPTRPTPANRTPPKAPPQKPPVRPMAKPASANSNTIKKPTPIKPTRPVPPTRPTPPTRPNAPTKPPIKTVPTRPTPPKRPPIKPVKK